MSWLDFANHFLSNQRLHVWSWINRNFLWERFFLVGNLALSVFGLFLFCFCLARDEQVTDAQDFGWPFPFLFSLSSFFSSFFSYLLSFPFPLFFSFLSYLSFVHFLPLFSLSLFFSFSLWNGCADEGAHYLLTSNHKVNEKRTKWQVAKTVTK